LAHHMRFEGLREHRWGDLGAQALIVVLSIAVVAVWVATRPIVFSYDTFTYVDQARELQAGKSADLIFVRLPLFPAILAAFNVTDLKHSVFGLIIFHSCLAVASCWLFYRAARLISPRGALILSLVFIASLLPFLNVKSIMTEQLFFFETVLAIYGIAAYLLAPTSRAAWAAAAVVGLGTVLMTLTRPQGAFVIPLIFGMLACLAWRRGWAPLLCAIIAFAAVWSVQAVDKTIRAGSHTSIGALDSSNMTGAMLLFSFYLHGPRTGVRISPQNGPATAELRALLVDELARPDALARRVGYLKSVPPEDVPAYVDKSLAEPDADFNAMLSYIAFKERLGPAQADRLLVRVCLEAVAAHPLQAAELVLLRLYDTYFDPLMLATPLHGQFGPGTFQPPLAEEVAAAGDYTNPTAADFMMDHNLRWLMRIAVVLTIVTLPVALRYTTWRLTVVLLILGLYLNFAVAVGNDPHFRYAIYAIPANLLCAYIGVVALAALLRDRYARGLMRVSRSDGKEATAKSTD
jgi:hypothetical protein